MKKIPLVLFISLLIMNVTNARTYNSADEAYEDSQKRREITICGEYRDSNYTSGGHLYLGGSILNFIQLYNINEAQRKKYDDHYICVKGRVTRDLSIYSPIIETDW